MEATENKVKGIESDDNIKMWKAKYRKVYEVIIEDDDEKFASYFKRPDMNIMSAVNKTSKNDEVKAAEILFDNCWLGGDPIVKEDAILRMSATAQLKNIMAVKSAELKNL
jgi:hypothetical protein